MPAAKHHHSVREAELARGFARVVEDLPLGLVLELVRFMLNSSAWASEATGDELIRNDDYRVGTEYSYLSLDGSRKRIDVRLPLVPAVSDMPLINDICFELKLDRENLRQVRQYAVDRPKSLVVSIARQKEIVSDELPPNLVRVEWTDWFRWMYCLLGSDAQRRLTTSTVEGDSPYERNLVDVHFSNLLERHLRDILDKGLVRLDTDRTIVVSGQNAVNTATHGVYYWGAG